MTQIPGTDLSGNQVMQMYIAFQVLSAFVQSLPLPAENGNVVYASLYKFLSLLIADFRGFVTKGAAKSLPTPAPQGQTEQLP